jgi:GH43 family beta-xylosidase
LRQRKISHLVWHRSAHAEIPDPPRENAIFLIASSRPAAVDALRNPWTLSERQVDIAAPTFAWEMQGGRKILEAPEFLEGPGGRVFLTYSASACWSDSYALGLLRIYG